VIYGDWLREKAKFAQPEQAQEETTSVFKRPRSTANSDASLYTAQKTARQTLLAKEDDTDKWYKGTVPTASEYAARIVTVSVGNEQVGDYLLKSLAEMQADPSTSIYDPYTAPTNQSLSALAELGLDTSGGATSKWIEQNSYLKNYYRTGVNGTPLAPTKNSTPEESAAYYYYKVLQDEDTTQKAETEWAAVQEQINYWAGRTDRNYSDEEILAKIDWADYPTLVSMDADKAAGTPTQLNRAVGYSQDALSGVVWAARNESTGNAFADSVASAMGKGNQYKADDTTASLLDPESENYDPYKVGSTLDDAALYFGVSSFDSDWLKNNRNALSSGDKTAAKYYQKVYDAEQFTSQAETELAALNTSIDDWLKYSSDPEVILDGLLDDSPTLKKIDESLKSGEVLSTTRAIDYRLQDVENAVRTRCSEINSEKQSADYTNSVVKVLGGAQSKDESAAAVDTARDDTISSAGGTIKQSGTVAEKLAFDVAYSADFGTYVQQIKDAIDNGTADPATSYQASLDRNDAYASKNYMAAKSAVAKYEEAVATKTAAEQSNAQLGAGVLPSTETQAALTAADKYIAAHQTEYTEAQQTIADIQDAYASSATLGQMAGGDTAKQATAGGVLSVMDYAYYYGKDYTPTEWSAQNIYDASLTGGYSYEATAKTATDQIAANTKEIDRIDYVLEQLDTNNVKIDNSYKTNLERRKAALERDTQDAQYFTLQSSDGFDTAAESYAQKVTAAWDGKAALFCPGERDGISFLSYSVVKPEYGINENQAPSMNDSERKTYLYLAGTQGETAAQDYYNHITDPTYGTVTVRQSEKYQEIVKEFADQNAVGATILSVVESPLQLAGTVYSVSAAISGQEINPYNAAFVPTQFVQGTREEVKANITKSLGEGTPAEFVANLGYDVATSSADSLTSGVLGGGSTVAAVSLMASGASASAMQAAKQNGATDEQALLQGGVTFFAESITEYIPLDTMIKTFKLGKALTIKTLLKNVAKSAMTEGAGEGVSQYIEGTTDDLIMGKLSQYNTLRQQYVKDGMTQDQADKKVTVDFWKDVTYNALAGALSGALSTGASGAANFLSRSSDGKSGGTPTVPTTNTPTGPNVPMEGNLTAENDQEASLDLTALDNAPASQIAPEVAQPEQLQTTNEAFAVPNILTAAYDRLKAAPVTHSEAVAIAKELTSSGGKYTGGSLVTAIEALTLEARDGASENDLYQQANSIAENLATDTRAAKDAYAEVREYLKTTPFRLTEIQRGEAASANDNGLGFRRSVFGKVSIKNDANTTLDQMWVELARMAPGLFPEDAAEGDMTGILSAALKKIYSAGKADETAQEFYRDTILDALRKGGQAQDQNNQAAARKVAALNSALASNDVSSQTATIAAALMENETDSEAATAAAKKLVTEYGAKKAIRTLRDVALSGDTTAGLAIIQTVLSGDAEASAALETVVNAGAAPASVSALVAAAQNVSDTPTVQAAINESMVAEQVKAIIADGALDGLQSFKSALSQAKENVRAANQQLIQAQKEHEIAGENAQFLNSQFVQDPTKPELRNSMSQAIKDLGGKAIVVQQMQASVDKYAAQQTTAQNMLTAQQNSVLKGIRQQAQTDVAKAQATREASVKTAMVQKLATESAATPVSPSKGSPDIRYAKGTPSAETATPPTAQTSAKRLTNPVEIAKSLAKTLSIGQAIGTRKMNNMPKEVKGFYDARAKYLAVRSVNAGDFTVTMHEIGHAVSDKLGIEGTPEMVANLDPMFATKYSAKELPGEAFAEFMWRYLTNDAEAVDFAGEGFIADFERRLKDAKLYKPVQQAKQQLEIYTGAAAQDQMGSMVVDRSTQKAHPFAERWTSLIAGMADDTRAAANVDAKVRAQAQDAVPLTDNLRNSALMRNTSAQRAFSQIDNALTDSHWHVIGESLGARFENAGVKGKDFMPTVEYMLALHSLDRDAQGKAVFDNHITKQARLDFIAQVEQERPEIARAAQAFQAFRTDFLQAFMVDTGYISQDFFDGLNKMYPNYVPTNRVKSGGKRNLSSDTYSIKKATGSTEEIYNPLDTFVQMVGSIVEMVSKNNAALTFDTIYNKYEGMGEFARKITPDAKKVTVDTTQLQEKIGELLTDNTDEDIMTQVLDLIGTEQTQWQGTGGTTLANSIAVQKPDGTKAYYEILEPALYNMFEPTASSSKGAWDIVGRAVQGMSRLITGTLFILRNAPRDFQKSVSYGTWASNYLTGGVKWVKAFYDVWQAKGEYEQYKALGGGGWTRLDAATTRGASEYRGELFKGYNTTGVGRTIKWAGKKVWNGVTLSRLNEIAEQTSRYAEYRFGKQDKTTAEGAQRAFLNAQEASVDFRRKGNSQIAMDIKKLVPFFSASVQGIYQTGREYTDPVERARLPARFAKTVLNVATASALAAGLCIKYADDDDKEEFAWLSDSLRSGHIYLPNFAPDVFGDSPYVRIPIAQDPLAYAVHTLATNAVWSGQGDDLTISAAALADTILGNLNPVNSTVFDPILSVSTNKTYFGSTIVPSYMSGWDATTQYTDKTADVFKGASNLLSGFGVKVSPLALEYIAQQYTGSLGQLALPAIGQKDIGSGVSAAVASARKRLTSDPLLSNDVLSSFYDGNAMLVTVTEAVDNDRPLNMLRSDLTPEQAGTAYQEAYDLTHTGGIIADTKKIVTEAYNTIDAIDANTTLTDEEKNTLERETRHTMLETVLDAQEAIGAYSAKYINGESILNRFVEGARATVPTAYDSLSDTFKADYDSGELYMKQAYTVWESTGKDSALPHPNESFSYKETKYTIETADWDNWVSMYKKGYVEYMAKNAKKWDALTSDEQIKLLGKAHEAAHDNAKDWYMKLKKIK